MNITLALMGLSIYLLLWEKLPEWGTWFSRMVERLPAPLAYLYEAWRCPYCFGFWVALLLHALTGIQTIAALDQAPARLGLLGAPLFWGLDALASATLIMLGKLGLSALAVPAIKGHRMTQAFKQQLRDPQAGQG
ncbi:hypothetical protein ACSX1C_01425 [Pseudomonas sp. MBLB4123]|uniref:hypothetical protein n=1 Tax=Pseudomonas sp. MBLB4123 TaxID=3451557 RepID=UPI003F751763